MASGWLKLHRGKGEALALLLRHPHALALLTLLATRARFSAGFDPASGVELQVGEALTGRGDAAAIGATPRQYRVCKDQLIKWGFVTTSRATKGATWGTVLKLTKSAIYEVVPLGNDHLDDHLQGHPVTTWGPPGGHESKTVDQNRTIPPLPPQGEPAAPGGGGVVFGEKVRKIEQLADKVVADAMKKGKEIKNIHRYREAVIENLGRSSSPELQKTMENQEDDGTSQAIREAEKTRKYLESLYN